MQAFSQALAYCRNVKLLHEYGRLIVTMLQLVWRTLVNFSKILFVLQMKHKLVAFNIKNPQFK